LRAQLLSQPSREIAEPLVLTGLPEPSPRASEIRIKISACGVCHTDLHLAQGELVPPHLPIVPGHQIVGTVEQRGHAAHRFQVGARVGVPWLNWIDPHCKWYGTTRENLCPNIRFTGFDTHGGFAEYICVDQQFAYPLPERFSDEHAAPLLCAGVIGYRALCLSRIRDGETLGLYGFGASAHLVLQIARHWGKRVFVFTRSAAHKEHARALGAEWVGDATLDPPQLLDSAIIFAPVGELAVRALAVSERGATVVHAGVHSTPLPSIDYSLLYQERVLTTAANSTRRDVDGLLELANEIPLETSVTIYPLAEANRALQDIKHSRVNGAAVLKIS
jgi:propanol-preferring alcohol dehydrogenase